MQYTVSRCAHALVCGAITSGDYLVRVPTPNHGSAIMFENSGDDAFDSWVARCASLIVVLGGGLALLALSTIAASAIG